MHAVILLLLLFLFNDIYFHIFLNVFSDEKIIELVKQSEGWSSIEASSDSGENVMMNVSEEELYNIPTAEYLHRQGFVNRQLTVYHVALHACADLKSKEALSLSSLEAGDLLLIDIWVHHLA
ncbi:hypothetical protein COCNU_12G001720 [Cocos nucifera]|uniref:Uncharacterized protein n=1 Tax=Cocos nucifera TaxID=13894 RepID=A0A8K0ISI4_COCNU|nr:hypothetical protein COCNU_12G001720 [Cocos nucifera]